MIIIDIEFWKAFGRVIKRFFTVQSCGGFNNGKEHFIWRSRFGLKFCKKLHNVECYNSNCSQHKYDEDPIAYCDGNCKK